MREDETHGLDDAIWSDKYNKYCPYNNENKLGKHVVTNNFKRAYIDLIQREFSCLVATPLKSIRNPNHMKYIGIHALLEESIDETLQQEIKLVTIGAHGAGKTALIFTMCDKWSYAFESFYPAYIEHETKEQEGKQVVYWDTAGEKEYDKLRVLYYPWTTVFLLCFSVRVRKNQTPEESDIAQAVSRFIPEVRKHCPEVPIILVGTMTDLRESPNTEEEYKLPPSFGEYIAHETGCLAYMETSAKIQIGIEDVKKAIVRAQKFAFGHKSDKKKCNLQ